MKPGDEMTTNSKIAMDEITWKQRITELIDSGLSLTELAGVIGIKPQGLCDLKSGKNKEPKGYVAVRLFRLHTQRCRIGVCAVMTSIPGTGGAA